MIDKRRPDANDQPPLRRNVIRERPTYPVDPSKIEVGDIMCTYDYGQVKRYGKVIAVDHDGTLLRLRNLSEQTEVEKKRKEEYEPEFSVDGRDKVMAMASANYFAEEIKITRTDMARILKMVEGTVFTVAFVTKDGTERVLHGHFVGTGNFGRALCRDLELRARYVELRNSYQERMASYREHKHEVPPEDLEPPEDSSLRLVDEESLFLLIVGGVRFVPKQAQYVKPPVQQKPSKL